MRILLFLLLIPLGSYGQVEILNLSFADESTELSSAHLTILDRFIKDKAILKMNVTAYVGSAVSVSKNRTRVEKRLVSLKNACQARGISVRIININYEVIQNENKFNLMRINLAYKPLAGYGVVYETSDVKITEVYPTQKNKPSLKVTQVLKPKVEEKPVPKTARALRKEAKRIKDSAQKAEAIANRKALEAARPPRNKYGLFNISDFKQGAQIVIPRLIFYATRHRLERSSLPSLKALLAIMKDKPSLVIRLEGHICCKKDGADGLDFDTGTGNLSENRARVVHDYLIMNGISPKRLSYIGYGSKYKKVEDNGNAIEGKENRRVEIYVVSE